MLFVVKYDLAYAYNIEFGGQANFGCFGDGVECKEGTALCVIQGVFVCTFFREIISF